MKKAMQRTEMAQKANLMEEAANTPKEELSDESGLIAFLEASAFDSQTKWEAVKIFSRQEAYYNEVAAILAEVMGLLRSKYARKSVSLL